MDLIYAFVGLSSSAMLVVPDFSQQSSDPKVAALKSRCGTAKPLGLARVDLDEIMVIYEGVDCLRTMHALY